MAHPSQSSTGTKTDGSRGLAEAGGWATSRTARRFEKAVAKAEEAIRASGGVVGDVATTVGQEARRLFRDTDTRPYEERTKEELYGLAARRGIAGRSTMRKAQLIAALRAAH